MLASRIKLSRETQPLVALCVNFKISFVPSLRRSNNHLINMMSVTSYFYLKAQLWRLK
jgi:hypothetical protein